MFNILPCVGDTVMRLKNSAIQLTVVIKKIPNFRSI